MQHWRFIRGVDEEFLCVACRLVLVDPVRLPCGDHEVCHACAASRATCPSCGVEVPTAELPRAAKTARLLAKMEVTCDFDRDGCAWTGPWSELALHRELHCAFQPLPCPYKGSGCPEVLERRAMPPHKAGCRYRSSQCEHCLKVVRDVDLPLHLDRCGQAPVSCQRCALPMPRASYERHLAEECAEGAVPCPLRFIGCEHVGKRKDTEAHLQESAPHHLRTLIGAVVEMREAHAREVSALRAELAAATARVERVDLTEVERLRATVEQQRVWLDRFASGRVVTVDPNGAGNFTTIGAALAACSADDAVLVRPGAYDGPVHVEKRGVVLRAAGDVSITSATGPALRLSGDGAAAEGFECLSTSPVSCAVVVEGARCALSDVVVAGAALHGIQIAAGGDATIARCSVKSCKQAAVEVRGTATIVDSQFSDSARPVLLVHGGIATATDCAFTGGQLNGAQVINGGRLEATRCRFAGNRFSNVDVVNASAELTDCDIFDSAKCGLCVAEEGRVDARACVISENALPNVAVLPSGVCSLERCTIERGRSHGVVVKRGGTCTIDAATVVRDNGDTAVAREGQQ